GQPVKLTLLSDFQDPYRAFYGFFKDDLARLGIELVLRDVPDSTAYVAELRKNTFDLVRRPLDIPRNFDVLDVDVLEQRLHSKFASSKFINNSANLKSKAIDRVLDMMHTTEADSPEYPVLVDALLRLLSSKTVFLMLGERSDISVYADPKLCFPPNSNWLTESAYFCH